MNGIGIALQSASILLREGLEAMLIITALAAALRKSEVFDGLRPLYIGAVAAIISSIAAGIIFQLYFDGTHNDLMEAVVMLVAAALMLYMSGWLFLRQDPKAWKAEIDRSAGLAIASGTAFSLGLVSFLAVFREGAETVLFLHALAQSSGGWSTMLILGLAGAAAALVVLYAAMQWLAVHLPLRPLFLLTSCFLFVMGLRFIGGAIQELQEQTIVPVDFADVPEWFISLGFNPTWEAIGAQVVIVLAAAVGLFWMGKRRMPATAS
jgi:high-affinity iron transporter